MIHSKDIIAGLLSCINELKNEGIWSNLSLMKYSDYNIHGFLQYCLIRGAQNANLMGIPEYRIRLSKPIDKSSVDPRFRKGRRRRIRTIRVDVGFLKEGKPIGVGEVYTPDEIHGCLPSNLLEDPWIAPCNKLTHIAKHEKNIEFILLVIGLWTLPSWKDAKKKTPQEWHKCWKKLVRQLSRYKQVAAVYIKGLNNIETGLPK